MAHTKVAELISGESDPYMDYIPKRVVIGQPHYAKLCEAAALASISLPEIKYELKLDNKFYEGPEACVSMPQLEAVIYACQSHMRFFRGKYENHSLYSEGPTQQENEEDNDEEEMDFSDDDDGDMPKDGTEFEQMDVDEVESEFMDVESYTTGLDEDEAIRKLGDDTDDEKTFRQGFFLGDGTGTGKSRILSCLIAEHYSAGGRKAIWITANADLFEGIRKEVEMFLLGKVVFRKLKDLQKYEPTGDYMEVLFLTYRGLTTTTMNMLIVEEWLGNDFRGLFLLDKCHLAKSAYMKGKQSCTGQRIMRLQFNYPRARVVYSTATAASEISHLFVLSRLQLWGRGTFYKDAEAFKETLVERGVAGLEHLAMQLKHRGIFLSRQLSFENVTVKFMEVQLSEDSKKVYYRSAQLWSLLCEYQDKLKEKFRDEHKGDPDAGATLAGKVATVHQLCQTFFGSLMTSAKLGRVEKLAFASLKSYRAVVIGLQRTGGSLFEKFIKEKWSNEMPFSNALCMLRTAMLVLGIPLGCPRTYLKNGAVVRTTYVPFTEQDCIEADAKWTKNLWMDTTLDYEEMQTIGQHGTGILAGVPMNDTISEWPQYSIGHFFIKKGLESPKDISWSFRDVCQNPSIAGFAKLYHELSLFLPINPLDEIISRFETPLAPQKALAMRTGINMEPGDILEAKNYPVAELTGRQHTYKFDSTKCRWRTEVRKRANKREMKYFMSYPGFESERKRVAVFSSSASTGFSLHADKNAGNQSKRTHITLECGWQAEQLLQQLGRTHRTNQRREPEYFIISSSIPAELRYMSIVGKRLKSIGAICVGHQQANPHSKYMPDDIFTTVGAAAINNATDHMLQESSVMKQLLSVVDIQHITIGSTSNGLYLKKGMEAKIGKFLNRLMILPVETQEKYLDHIQDTFQNESSTTCVYRTLREIPRGEQEVDVINQLDIMFAGKMAKVFHFRVSRYASWEYVVNLQIKSISFSKYSLHGVQRVLAVYPNSENDLYALFPFNKNAQKLKDTIVGRQHMYKGVIMDKPDLHTISIDEARIMWCHEVENILEKPLECGHSRSEVECDYKREYNQCTLMWGITECVIVTGRTNELLHRLKPISNDVNLGKVSYSDEGVLKTVAGIYYSPENCRPAPARVLNSLVRYLPQE